MRKIVEWIKAGGVMRILCSGALLICYLYAVLFLIHFNNKNIILGIILSACWLVCVFLWFSISMKAKDIWQAKLIIASILTFFLIIPVDKYEKVFVRPFENVSKAGPFEFFRNISKTESSSIAFEPELSKRNYINNGGFEIPLFSKDSNWGTGKHSDRITGSNPYESVYFIKFGGVIANADISSEESIGGLNSLHIRHESDKKDNVVGVLEQRVYLEPGRYELSMKAKLGYAVSQGAVWVRFDSEKWLETSGFSIPDEFPIVSSWAEKKRTFSIDNCGNFRDENGAVVFCLRKEDEQNNRPVFSTTFSIITTDQCEIWIDNIKLTRRGD